MQAIALQRDDAETYFIRAELYEKVRTISYRIMHLLELDLYFTKTSKHRHNCYDIVYNVYYTYIPVFRSHTDACSVYPMQATPSHSEGRWSLH